MIGYLEEQYPQAMRALVAEKDGEIVGIVGVLHGAPLQAFSQIGPEIRHSPRSLGRGVRMFRDILNSYDGTIYAIASPDEENPGRFLEWVGFEPVDDYEGLYQWKQQPQKP